VLTGNAPLNLGNLSGRMEYGQMVAGCAASLASRTGSIGYVGSLVNNQTQRNINAAFLGANFCWQTVRNQPTPLKFAVNWVGYLFNIPGVTADPTQLTANFYNNGSDVVISGLDTEDVLYVAQQRVGVFAIPYNTTSTCPFTTVCLGVPYFNWGPTYLNIAQQVQTGTWQQSWDYLDPDWTNLADTQNNLVQWVNGPALSADAQAQLLAFTGGLGDASINLYEGPLKYANGTTWVAIGESASPETVWYTDQLLTGIVDQSTQPTAVPQ
jgi:simple sugar transport system substrate-binding protein